MCDVSFQKPPLEIKAGILFETEKPIMFKIDAKDD